MRALASAEYGPADLRAGRCGQSYIRCAGEDHTSAAQAKMEGARLRAIFLASAYVKAGSGRVGTQSVIDLHCHMLPGIDDGAPDLDLSLEMARVAVADGITVTACTPHIMPGVYDNTGELILGAIGSLQAQLDAAEIPLRLVCGADVHIAPGLAAGLRAGRLLSLNHSRYFLFEPPHHVAPPRIEQTCFDALAGGFIPVITHPERLTWIEGHYDKMLQMVRGGALIQLTGGSVTGRFGRRPKYWSERMLDEGVVHLLATDAHNLGNRSPVLSEARDAVAERLGEEVALDMVLHRPQEIIDNAPPRPVAAVDPPEASVVSRPHSLRERLAGLFGR